MLLTKTGKDESFDRRPGTWMDSPVVPSPIDSERELDHSSDFQEGQALPATDIVDIRQTQLRRSTPDPPITPARSIIATPSRGLDAPVDKVVTVEDFLKRAYLGLPAKTRGYGKKPLTKKLEIGCEIEERVERHAIPQERQHGIRNCSRPNARCPSLHDESSDLEKATPGQQTYLNSKRNPRLRSTRLKRKPLHERLYEAAVMTGGNPDDSFIHGGTKEETTRLPLHFIPGVQSQSPQSEKRRPWSLIDPRKTLAIRTASFSRNARAREITNTPLLVNTLDRLPLTSWNVNLKEGLPQTVTNPTKKRRNNEPEESTRSRFNYTPLSFISLNKAEEDYKVMFSCTRCVQIVHIVQHCLLISYATSRSKDKDRRRDAAWSCKTALAFKPIDDTDIASSDRPK